MKQIYYNKSMCKHAIQRVCMLLLAVMMSAVSYAQSNAIALARVVTSSTLPTSNTEWPADVKWQYLTIHANGYVLEHVDGQAVIALNTQLTDTRSDSRLWAFIGNTTDGYRLYNKAAGPTKVLSSATGLNGFPVLKEFASLGNNDVKTWDVLQGHNSVAGSVYIAQHGTNNRMNRNAARLGYWSNVDGGSAFVSYPIDLATSTPQVIKQYVNTAITHPQVAANIIAGGRYVFYQSARRQYLYNNGSHASAQLRYVTPRLDFSPDYNYVWEVEAASAGGFYVKHLATGKYLGNVTAAGTPAPMVADQSAAMRVEFTEGANATSVGIKAVGTDLYFNGFGEDGGANSNLFITWTDKSANYQVFPVQSAATDATPYSVNVTHEAFGTNHTTASPATTGAIAGTPVQIYPGNKALPLMFSPIITPQALTLDGTDFTTAGNITGNGHTVAITYNLPFDLTTDIAQPVWQGMQLHQTARYTIAANTDGTQVLLQSAASAAERIKDPALWAITGDLVNGFKLYNKLHTTAKLLYSVNGNNGTPVQLGDATANAANGTYFIANYGQGYVVYRKNGNGRAHFNNYANTGVVKYWQDADAGSMVFFTNQADLLSQAQSTIAAALAPYEATKGTDYIGSLSESDYNSLEQELQAGLTTLDQFATWSSNLEAKQVAYKPNRLYKLIGVGSTRTLYVDYATGAVKFKEMTTNNEVAALWKLSGAANAVKVSNPNTEKYFKLAGSNLSTVAEANATVYTLQAGISTATNALYGDDGRFPMLANNTDAEGAVGFDQVKTQEKTNFHLKEMKTFDVTITAAGYATTKLPFAVQLPQGGALKAFIVTALPSKIEATLEEVTTTIPANTPVVFKGIANTYTLTIDYDNTEVPLANNLLTGVTAPGELAATDFIFANKNNTPGFYKTSRATATYGPNKAILPASVVPAGATRFLIEAVVTNIATATADTKHTTYYNLQGQRVEQPTRGIYITGEGKKVVIK